ncbi:superantigen-like protein [Staphylococcus chromogenes]|uniref:exotoxin beta-grasp domain-containing protein n=1 Tax=Staphylococcus chromogenes TaxID=46126 RepID=UPI001E4DCDC1|nr:superantigen-like protein [Staphylococcus chromogenes]MCD8904189.1 superantigen-like protein [Staphylococcus chromogenes]
MKLSTIAKTSLALGILTTGVMTTHAQSVDAAQQSQTTVKNNSEDVQKLHDYYTSVFFDLRNVSGDRVNNKVNVVNSYTKQLTEIDLLGSDITRLDSKSPTNIDVFVLRDGSGRQATDYSIGGITKTNSKKYTDYVAKPELFITKDYGEFKSTAGVGPYFIDKEEISLKELDFKLRNKLIKEFGLYKDGVKNGTIVVKMKGNNPNHKYTFELDKKLQDHRMGDVIDATQIDRIDVEYK